MAQRSRKRGRRRPAKAASSKSGSVSGSVSGSGAGRAGQAKSVTPPPPAVEKPAKGNPAKSNPAKGNPAKGKSASRAGWRVEPPMSRTERRNAEARAGLTPINPGERPGAIQVGAAVAALLGVGNLVAFVAGVKVGGKHPAAGGIIVFSALMIACAVGMWRLWYGAVLGFMALLAIIATIFALLLIEASNVLGLVVALAVVGGSGYLFFKLVRVLSRIQMPRYPGR